MKQDNLVDESEIEKIAEEYAKGNRFRFFGFLVGFKAALSLIQSNAQSNLQSKGASKEQLYFNTLTEDKRIKYFEDVEVLKKGRQP